MSTTDRATIHIGADHAGVRMKHHLISKLQHDLCIVDHGTTDQARPTDYPDIAHTVAKHVQQEKNSIGILICGTGIGMAMAANRHTGIRAAQVSTAAQARLARKHNNANIITLAGRYTTNKDALRFVRVFLKTQPDQDMRHARRRRKIEPKR